MPKKKKLLLIILAIIIVWIAVFCIDYSRIVNDKKPVFCINNQSNDEYIGLGYKYIGGYNSISDNNEYVCYLFGFEIFNNLTN